MLACDHSSQIFYEYSGAADVLTAPAARRKHSRGSKICNRCETPGLVAPNIYDQATVIGQLTNQHAADARVCGARVLRLRLSPSLRGLAPAWIEVHSRRDRYGRRARSRVCSMLLGFRAGMSRTTAASCTSRRE